jgi:hypothetical protein
MQPSPEMWEALFVNQSLGCFCLTYANVAIGMAETGTNFAMILKPQGIQTKLILETSL